MTRRPPHAQSTAPRATGEALHGINSVEQALQAGKRRTYQMYLKEDGPSNRLSRLRELAALRRVPCVAASAMELERLCDSPHHQGVALECGPLPLGDEREALALAARPESIMLALDQVTDPQNLGAAIRNAAVFGLAGVVLPRHQSAPLSPAASRASAGRMEAFPLFEVANLPRFLESCRRARGWVAGTAEDGETPLPRLDLGRPLVVVMGSEHKGLRPLVRAKCDVVVSIPAPGGGSLNVASATAIVLYHLTCRGEMPRGERVN